MTRRDVRNLLLAALATSVGGCGTMDNFGQGFSKQHPAWHGGMPRYYGGVRMYLDPGTRPDEALTHPDAPWYDVPLMVAFLTIDIPLTLLADTLTIPLVVAAQREAAGPRPDQK